LREAADDRLCSGAGLSLAELIIVISLIAILGAVAVPNVIAARMDANESSAVSVLHAAAKAQSQFWRGAYADEDGDGQGEYGTFGEISGAVGVRGGTHKAATELLSIAGVSADGEARSGGYVFRMYLPGPGGVGVRERSGGGIGAGALAPDLSERHWCCYAWPIRRGASARHAFFINEYSEVCETEDPRYDVANCGELRAGAAFATGGLDAMTGAVAIGTRGADGNYWRPVQ
jgi:hypothetical protein